MTLSEFKLKYPFLQNELLQDVISTVIDTNVSPILYRTEAVKRQSVRLRTALFMYYQQHTKEVGCDFEEFYKLQMKKWISRVEGSI